MFFIHWLSIYFVCLFWSQNIRCLRFSKKKIPDAFVDAYIILIFLHNFLLKGQNERKLQKKNFLMRKTNELETNSNFNLQLWFSFLVLLLCFKFWRNPKKKIQVHKQQIIITTVRKTIAFRVRLNEMQRAHHKTIDWKRVIQVNRVKRLSGFQRCLPFILGIITGIYLKHRKILITTDVYFFPSSITNWFNQNFF